MSTPDYDILPRAPLVEVRTAIKLDGNSNPIACRGVSVQTTGAFTVTNPDGSTAVPVLNSGVIHDISTKVLPTGASTVWVWY